MASSGVLTLALGVLCLFVGTASAFRSCRSGYEEILGDCFKLVTDRKSVDEATRHCASDGGTLASTRTLKMKEAVVNFVNRKAPGQYWTSGKDLGRNGFVWTDTQGAINISFRGRNFQSGRCVYMCSYTRMFWDRPCDQRLGFICHIVQARYTDTVQIY